jgi:citrate lyase subunit beta / citryl-CoA lyase
MSYQPIRSMLLVPGIRRDFLQKAPNAGADALVLDLEDSVPAAAKPEARTVVANALAQSPENLTFIRFNHPSVGNLDDDLMVLAPHENQAIMLSKVGGPQDIVDIDAKLSNFERSVKLRPHSISMVIMVESSIGLRNMFDTLRSTSRIRGAALATAEEGDFMNDIGGQWTPSAEALTYARGKFVCDARAAGVNWVLDGAFINLRDNDALEKESRIARIHGFNGKAAIHPRQVPVINRVFSPTPEELERAQQMIEAFRIAEAAGHGAIRFQGMMVDYANVRRAEQILALVSPRHLDGKNGSAG